MPHVRKSELLGVVRELWGATGVLEDEAKLVLAEQLINDVWADKKTGIAINAAGVPIKAALGDRWLSSHERTAAGKPSLRQVLADDPFFVIKESGLPTPNVRLRISRLSQLIGHPDLIEEYRWTPASGHQQQPAPTPSLTASLPSSSSSAAAGAAGATASGRQQPSFNSEGLPLRPGSNDCPHYVKHGWCLFKQECWYNHPELRARAARSKTAAGELLVESRLEPGVMLLGGLHPVRPGHKLCAFYMSNGYCMFKAKCKNHHPTQAELAGRSPSGTGPTAEEAAANSPVVKQPPAQQLLGVVVDAVWPPQASKESAVRGALAKALLEHCLKPGEAPDDSKPCSMLLAQAGIHVNKWWNSQPEHDPAVKPYKALADVLVGDECYDITVNDKGAKVVHLLLRPLLELGGHAAAAALTAMADVVWPPLGGGDVWLRGKLAKWLMVAGFEGGNGTVLRQVLAVRPDAPTVFRIDMAQAGEYLRRCWESGGHPYDSSTPPWTKFNALIAQDRFLYIEPAPGKANSQHVTLDLGDMLNHYTAIAKYTWPPTQPVTLSAGAGSSSSAAGGGGGGGGGEGTPAAAAGSGSGTNSSSAAAAAAAGGVGGSAAGDDALDLQDDSDDPMEFLGAVAGAAAAAAAASSGGGGRAPPAPAPSAPPPPAAPAAPAVASARGAGDTMTTTPITSSSGSVAQAEADLAAIAALDYEPPDHMQWWWPEGRPESQNSVWAEIAIRLVDPFAQDAELQIAEMVQHLEICPVLSVACATYKSHPHLLQFFAPHAAVGGLQMPAAVYLLDVMKPGRQVQQVLELVKPVLASPANLKVCHGSKLWSGQLEKAFHITLNSYFDTQQANYVWQCLRFEAGRSSHSSPALLKNTAEVSLSALLRTFDFYHPERHSDNRDTVRVWQDRPLTEQLITCAAADVAYLLPLMEIQVRNLKLAAADVKQQQVAARPGSRAAALLSSLPPELAEPNILSTLAQGAEARGGSLSMSKAQEWGQLGIFHQAPLHDAALHLHQSYGAIRGAPYAGAGAGAGSSRGAGTGR